MVNAADAVGERGDGGVIGDVDGVGMNIRVVAVGLGERGLVPTCDDDTGTFRSRQ